MTAPDKIYTDNRGVYAELPIFSQADANVEYIRKNTLLKWIEGKMTVEDETEGYIGGYDAALKEVIDKINSL